MPTIDIPPLNSQKRGNLQDFRHSLDDWIPIDADLTIYTSTKLRVATVVCIEHEGIRFVMLTFMFVTQYFFCPPKKRQSNINWEILRI